jgi:pilus assembly protein CpaD
MTVSMRADHRGSVRVAGLAASILLGAAAAACAYPGPDPWVAPLPQDAHAITVRQDRAMAEIPVQATRRQLSYVDIAAVESMGREYLARGHGPIVLALPVGGGNDEAAVAVGAQAREVLYDMGVAYRMIQGTSYDAGGQADAPIVVMVDRYVADAPACHDQWKDFARTYSGEATANFGCSVQANLAAVVTDPADLVGPRPETPPDAGRRSTAVGMYRSGQSTVTSREPTESANVSDAVE